MCEKIRTWVIVVWAVISSVVAIVAYILFTRAKKDSYEEKAKYAKDKAKTEIENTSAANLVAAADNADVLCSKRESIREKFRTEVRNRLKQTLHGSGS